MTRSRPHRWGWLVALLMVPALAGCDAANIVFASLDLAAAIVAAASD